MDGRPARPHPHPGAGNGKLVPLCAFAQVERTAGPLTINQLGQLPAVTISFNLPAGVSLGDAVSRIDAIKAELNVPTTISTTFAGTAKMFQDALANQGLLLAAAIITIYIVLGILYESFVHPLTILTGLPAAAVGALGALELFGHRPLGHRHHRHPDADRHREEERDHDDRRGAREAARGGRRAVRRDPRGVPAALPPDHDDDARRDHGHACRSRSAPAPAPSCASRSASRWSAACSCRRLLTLFITPVLYLYMDRLSHGTTRLVRRLRGKDKPAPAAPEVVPEPQPAFREAAE